MSPPGLVGSHGEDRLRPIACVAAMEENNSGECDGRGMNILLIGSGGREHALAWAICGSPLCDRLYAAPGNPGMEECAICVDLDTADHEADGDPAVRRARHHSQRKSELPLECLIRRQQRHLPARRARTPSHGSAVTGHDLHAREAFVARTEREQDVARQELAASAQQVEFSRGRLVEAGRDREVLERLKRRRESEHNREIARREEQSLAEIALTAHLRNRSAA